MANSTTTSTFLPVSASGTITTTTTSPFNQQTLQQAAQIYGQAQQQGLYSQGLQGIGQVTYGGVYYNAPYAQNMIFTHQYPPRAPLKSDAVYSSISRLSYALESKSLEKLTSGMILGWMAAHSPRHQKKMKAVAEAIRGKIASLRAFTDSWEPGKSEA